MSETSALGAPEALIRPKSLDLRFLSYLHADHPSDGNALAEGQLTFEGRKIVAPDVEAVVSARILGDMRSLSSGVIDQIHDRAARRPNLNADEAYLNCFFEHCDLRLGKQKISWGRADGLNPTDVFGAFDYADLLNPDRLGVFGLRAFFYSGQEKSNAVEIVVLPFYSPSRAGRGNTRWRPLLENGAPAVPVDVRFPKNTISNADYGIRISREIQNWDVSAGYARTIDDLAGGEMIAAPIVRPLFLKKRTAGIDASRGAGDGLWEIHAEAAYTSTPSGNDDDFIQVVAGGRRSFTDVYRSVDLDLTIEWAGEHVFSGRQNPSTIVRNLTQRPFPGSVLIKTEWELRDFFVWTAQGAYTFRGRDAYLITNELSRRVSDTLELRIALDILSGKGSRATQAAYEENDRWRFEATIYFW